MKPENETKSKLLETATTLIWQSSYGSVSVDDICTHAGVNKGSFYYAFKSKSDLAVAAFEHHWQSIQPAFDRIFSPLFAPLERFDKYCQLLLDVQKREFQSKGKVLGCPFCSLGCELSTQDENIRQKAEQISSRMIKYLESAVRDLIAQGLIEADNAHELAQEIYSHVTGALTQSKIENSLKPLERLKQSVQRLLNIKKAPMAPA